MRTNFVIVALLAASLGVACSQTTEPELGPQGRVTLHFASAQTTPAPARETSKIAMAAPAIDSVVVRVFRPGMPITQETSKGVALEGADVDVSLGCIAENGKRVSVDLYEAGKFTHHGFATGVNVVKGTQTPVSIDAYEFTVSSLNVTPSPIATEPALFDLSWNYAPAATSYDVQTSATPDFAAIEWQQSATDTVLTGVTLDPGGHYFRVVPRTPYAHGLSCPEQYAYLRTTSGVVITRFSVPAAKPADVITIFGENFDYPGTQVTIGSRQMQILSSSWGALDVLIPRGATTEGITVSNAIGFDTKTFVVQRVAYVTSGGAFTQGYVTALEKHNDDFGYSGVAVVTLPQLDTQDMRVFDVIVVAHDTGTSLSNWGGGQPTRANAILGTRANVLAMGRGGAVFLDLVGATTASYQTSTDTDGAYYAPDGTVPIFSTPHSVGGGSIDFTSASNATTTDFSIASSAKPAGVNLYASTDCVRSLGICLLGQPNDRWVLADFRFANTGGDPVLYASWGYADDPTELTTQGTDVLGNIMNRLYKDRLLAPVE